MDTQSLNAEKRSILGRKVKAMRKEGKLPGNVYGKNQPSVSITLVEEDFAKVFGEAGETGIVELALGAKKTPVLIGNVQTHPVSGKPMHVDFRAVNLKEKVTATVPVELTGESPAEKNGLGTVVQQISELEVEALPTDLPDALVADISVLTEVDQAILIKDLSYDKTKVEVEADPEQLVAKVEPPQEEVAPEPAEEPAAEEEAAAAGAIESAEAPEDEAGE